jgi:hypothetical protein
MRIPPFVRALVAALWRTLVSDESRNERPRFRDQRLRAFHLAPGLFPDLPAALREIAPPIVPFFGTHLPSVRCRTPAFSWLANEFAK